jgi:hypothetical protein
MFGRLVKSRPSDLDGPINAVLARMNNVKPDHEEYTTLVNHLERLNQMKACERRTRVSPDTVATVVGNLLGILVIVAYEQKHVMVSKGLGFVMRPREPHINP